VLTAIRSPHHRAGFRFGDLSAWRARNPRVAAILTAADIPGRNLFGVIPPFADQPALAAGDVRFRGDADGRVAWEEDGGPVAGTGCPAEWRPLRPLMWPAEAMEDAAPRLHEGRSGNELTRGLVRRGDVAAALAASVHSVEGHFVTSFV